MGDHSSNMLTRVGAFFDDFNSQATSRQKGAIVLTSGCSSPFWGHPNQNQPGVLHRSEISNWTVPSKYTWVWLFVGGGGGAENGIGFQFGFLL